MKVDVDTGLFEHYFKTCDSNRLMFTPDTRLVQFFLDFANRYADMPKFKEFNVFGIHRGWPIAGLEDHKGTLTVFWNYPVEKSILDLARDCWVDQGELAQNVFHKLKPE